ncbi:MAG: radical SAM protein [Planctomycetota bacterium]
MPAGLIGVNVIPTVTDTTGCEPLIVSNRFKVVYVLMTNKCNLECKHCYVSSGPRGEYGLSVERMMRLSDEVYETIGSAVFGLGGGEALVRLEDTLRVIEHARRHHEVKLVTNGTLITPAVARQLTRNKIHIKISLDGGTAELHDFMRGRGAFARTMRGIQNLLDAGQDLERLGLGATLPSCHIEGIGDVLAVADRFGVMRVRFGAIFKGGRAVLNWPHIPTTDTDHDNNDFKAYFKHNFEKEFGDKWCLIDADHVMRMYNTLNIYYDGEVYVVTPADRDQEKSNCLGSVANESLGTILQEERVSRVMMRQFLRHSRGPEKSARNFCAIKKELLRGDDEEFALTGTKILVDLAGD